MRPITAHALGHFCMNFKKVIFFEYLIMFRNFLALVLRILGKRAHCSNPNIKGSDVMALFRKLYQGCVISPIL